MAINDLVNIREFTKTDLNFILDSSLQCLSKYTESIVKGQSKDTAYKYLEKIVLYALNYMDYSVFIACHKKDSDNIIAYIIADPKSNHIFLQYTKYSFRKLGIQQLLLLPLVIDPVNEATCNWPTKEMLKLVKSGKISIKDRFVEEIIGVNMELKMIYNKNNVVNKGYSLSFMEDKYGDKLIEQIIGELE